MNPADKMPSASQAAFHRLLETIRAAADSADQNENVSLKDKQIVRNCLSDLNAYAQALVDSVTHNGTNDHIIDWMGSVVSAAFFIGSYSVVPDSSYMTVQQHQAFKARAQRKKEVARKADKKTDLLRKHIPDLHAGLQHPSSTAEAILQAINNDLLRAGGKAVTSKTVFRWIKKLQKDVQSDIS